jgi:hypothetical protein
MGCDADQQKEGVERLPQFPDGIRVAVAPALNFSGSLDFDPVQVADAMASELAGFEGVGVIGVNRVLAILAEQGVDRIQSPQHALDVCDRLGADAILVFAITEYDAYTPVVGIAAQLYGPQPPGPMLDPVTASRMARPFPVAPSGKADRPQAQCQRVFHGAHRAIQDDVRRYADGRSAEGSPYGWRKYLASQTWYLRYCSHRVAQDLLLQRMEQNAATTLAAAEESGS